jgi:HAD superfamily hydrolase (TIGR01509 family)
VSSFRLVIFDCDGVLVDSEPIANRVFCGMLNELGISVTLKDMFERFVGHSMEQCIEIVTELLGKPPPDSFVPELRRRTAIALEAGVKAVEGVKDAINGINIPMCVASSGLHDKIRLNLGKTGLLNRFEGKIFSVVDVKNPKPAPDVFLYAASCMGVHPKYCAVIEDTPTGVKAGVAAGMHVYGFTASTPEHRLKDAGAHKIFATMDVLPELLLKH